MNKADDGSYQKKHTMALHDLFSDRSFKPKARTDMLCSRIIEGAISTNELIDFANGQKPTVKATCMEALEHATALKPEIADLHVFEFAGIHLADRSPRLKWESARVLSNVAHLFPHHLNSIIPQLLINATDGGTVVRWSSVVALSAILKQCGANAACADLKKKMEALAEKETKASIQKIYRAAIKEAGSYS